MNGVSRKNWGAHSFTLIELLIVITIIIVLAGLIIGTSGYVQNKGKRSRAEAEIAAMSAALESYKADNGIYPQTKATDSLDAKTDTNPTSYQAASLALFDALSGGTNGSRTPSPGAKSYFNFKSNMLSPSDTTQPVTAIRDPFRNAYGYSTAKAATPGANVGYNPTFDLWSTAGETTAGTEGKWIKNW